MNWIPPLVAAMQEIGQWPLVAGLAALVDEHVTAVAHLPHEFATRLALNWHRDIYNVFQEYLHCEL